MNDKNYFELLPEQTKKRLVEQACRVEGVVPVETGFLRFATNQLGVNANQGITSDTIAAKLEKTYTYIYYFHVTSNSNLEVIERVFSGAKQQEKNQRAYPRFNRQSEFLYVGSSSNMIQRLKEHLGYGSSRTYSLQLVRWASHLNLDIDFVYAKYASSVSHDVIQSIEDTLWIELSPMFGREGKR